MRIFCSATTGKSILQPKQKAVSWKFSSDGNKLFEINNQVINNADTMRLFFFPSNGQQLFAITGDELFLQDIFGAQKTFEIPMKNESKYRAYTISNNLLANQVSYSNNLIYRQSATI